MNSLDKTLLTAFWAQQGLPNLFACFCSRFEFFSAEGNNTYHMPESKLDAQQLDEHVNAMATPCDVEAQLLWVRYLEIEESLRALQPGIVRIKHEDTFVFLGIVGARGNKLKVIDSEYKEIELPLDAIARRLKAPLELPLKQSITETIAPLELKGERGAAVGKELLRQRLSNELIGGLWAFRPSANAAFFTQFKHAGLWKTISALFLSYAGFYFLWLVAWAVIGLGAVSGQLDKGWLALWVICLATIIPLYMVFNWQSGKFSIGTGSIIKRKLLAGSMLMNSDEVKTQGAGQLLGRVIESTEFERLALSGGILAIVAVLELLMTAFILMQGVSAVFLLLLLITLLAVIAVAFYKEFQCMQVWTDQRIKLTTDLVENMVGHRTRIAQQAPEAWHQHEDEVLETYMQDSAKMDKMDLFLATLPRVWLVLALCVLSYSFVYKAPQTVVLAIALGAVLLCYRSLNSLTAGLKDIAKSLIAWHKIEPIFSASKHESSANNLVVPTKNEDASDVRALLKVKELGFRYSGRKISVVNRCSFDIYPKDKILLEGSSGGGKSTLATLLCGLIKNQSGLMLLKGLDISSIGIQNWRKKVVLVPQFHENHIFMGPFAFNLLMGREWPPSWQDMQDAASVCAALGLDDLVSRMPGGMMQLVGDTGWQLSHGEKSRVYIARALLQKPDLLLLDESFAALDPENTAKALNYVIEESNVLMVIAHP